MQSSNHKQYCTQNHIPYRTFKRKYSVYKNANNKENWSPNNKRRHRHRVFTDSTEKQAVKQLIKHKQYINQQNACNNSDLLNSVRAQRKSYNKSTVDDTTISTFQQTLIDTLNDYNHRYVMNSDQTRIQQFC